MTERGSYQRFQRRQVKKKTLVTVNDLQQDSLHNKEQTKRIMFPCQNHILTQKRKARDRYAQNRGNQP